MQEIHLLSTKAEIATFTLEECEAALKELQTLFIRTQDPDLIIRSKLCKTRISSRLNYLKSVS